MATWQLIAIAAVMLLAIIGLLWSAMRLHPAETPKSPNQLLENTAQDAAQNIFDTQFREELRNRGRLYFEKIINENAMFLQQDLRLTTSQLNDYLKDEIKRTLQEEFAKYEESIVTAKDMALETIQKTQTEMEQQRQLLSKQMTDEVNAEKKRVLDNFDKNMADIVNHYILAAIGSEVDLTTQLDFIFQRLEENKDAILQDIKSGS
jgi:F0F1-type ATP synthase membrane subunit b/b'